MTDDKKVNVTFGNDGGEEGKRIEVVGNNIYFYSILDAPSCLELIKKIREVDVALRTEAATRMIPIGTVPIWLHINSIGGNLYDAFGVADQLMTIASPIHSIVVGMAASGATVLSIACTKRLIMPNAFMLIHQFTSPFWGKYSEFQDEMKLQDMSYNKLVQFYVKKTRMKKEEIVKALEHDFWVDAKGALRYGLVDEIVGV